MNTRSQPRYVVGEYVIICSTAYPHLTGRVVQIRAIHYPGEHYMDRISKVRTEVVLRSEPFVYRMAEQLSNDRDQECLFTERALRKKHVPSHWSFADLLKHINRRVN